MRDAGCLATRAPEAILRNEIRPHYAGCTAFISLDLPFTRST
jgi:hypothetical protein